MDYSPLGNDKNECLGKMEALLEEHRRYDGAHLGHAVDDCQKAIDLLISARESIVAGEPAFSAPGYFVS